MSDVDFFLKVGFSSSPYTSPDAKPPLEKRARKYSFQPIKYAVMGEFIIAL